MKHWLLKLAVASLVAMTSIAAWAHGGQKHLMGMVKAISERSITVETTAKREVVAEIDAATKLEKDGAPAKAEDFAIGQRVVVHAKGGPKGLVAVLIKGGVAKKRRAPAADKK